MSINQFCTVAVPIFYCYCAFVGFFGQKIEYWLIETDTYAEGQLQVRSYSVITTCLTLCSLVLAAGYLCLAKIWHVFAMFVIMILGIVYMKVCTYHVQIRFTDDMLYYQSLGAKRDVPFSDILSIQWKTSRHSIGYLLYINCIHGPSFVLSSRDFVGLVSLKERFEAGRIANIPDDE